MKIDLCKLLGVEEGEEFIVEFKDGHKSNCKYRVMNNLMEWSERGTKYDGVYNPSCFSVNDVNKIKNIIKLPKKKEFSQDTLNFFKMIDKKYKWIAKDKSGDIFVFEEKPKKDKYVWLCEEYDYCLDNTCCIDGLNQSLFNEILWEDDEPIYIDDYVER